MWVDYSFIIQYQSFTYTANIVFIIITSARIEILVVCLPYICKIIWTKRYISLQGIVCWNKWTIHNYNLSTHKLSVHTPYVDIQQCECLPILLYMSRWNICLLSRHIWLFWQNMRFFFSHLFFSAFFYDDWDATPIAWSILYI